MNIPFFRKPIKSHKTITDAAITAAYKRRIKDIESLRQYDRGEKEIHAPNIRDIVQDVRRSS